MHHLEYFALHIIRQTEYFTDVPGQMLKTLSGNNDIRSHRDNRTHRVRVDGWRGIMEGWTYGWMDGVE
jgi:hypothetical protein